MDISVFAVLGGDQRCAELASLLAADGFTVYASGFEKASRPSPCVVMTDALTAAAMSQAVILPVVPVKPGGGADDIRLNAPLSDKIIPLDEALAGRLTGRDVFCGSPDKLRAVSQSYAALRLRDYGAEESFLLPNARLTAEAAVMLAIQEHPAALYDARCLVTGYGRIGKALSAMLYSLGARVTVCARRVADRALAATAGCRVTDFSRLPLLVYDQDIVFNTADANVITRSVIERMRPDALILDLASAPWGTDEDAAAGLGIRYMRCPGLPGKYSPLTAAKIIKDTVLSMTGGEKT